MQAVSIRKAETTDASILIDIGFQAWETSILPVLDPAPNLREVEMQRLKQAVNASLDRIIVAEMEGEVVGWCSRLAGRAYIPYLFVTPDMQSHGIGSMLLRRMESMIELSGADRVRLETPADNVRAVRFYEKQGYHIMSRPADHPAHRAYLSIWLEKPLSPFLGAIADDE
ncbi:GNAT family N-acetyltransferase [Devosia algicola]|uniref:GNAT family N-acetyltransferase n=1 Tax=Devosia algicola TaxID=3026418 RepID=A0ABY7YPZ1_9HYPH|nr:GNAT family N-acetyltransferase [Devosia algicola]WDR03383.1 GNAT family N-acetyltransferase [Devosia algicola]